MTVQKTDIHKKISVSDGEVVDKGTKGNLAFAVDKEGLARPLEASTQDGFVVNDRVLLAFMRDILVELRIIKTHLMDITEENFDGSN